MTHRDDTADPLTVQQQITTHAKRLFPDYEKVVNLGITIDEITNQAMADVWGRLDRAARARAERFRHQSAYLFGPER